MTREEALDILAPYKWTPSTGFSSFDSADNYAGEHVDGYIIAAQNRGSDVLTRSNWIVARDRFPTAEIYSFGHWACGWVEHLILALDAPDETLIEAAEMIESLKEYPVLSDEHFSDLEYDEACEYWESCSMRTRIELCQHHGVSIFAARRDELPETPTGELCTYN